MTSAPGLALVALVDWRLVAKASLSLWLVIVGIWVRVAPVTAAPTAGRRLAVRSSRTRCRTSVGDVLPHTGPGGRARILTVCTGNICRSPYAERVLRHALPAESVEVASAGTGALVGEGIDPEAVALLGARGVDHLGHHARQLTRGQLADADLVLAMTTQHRAAVARLLPRAVHRTFTALEVARLLPATDLAGLPADPGGRLLALPAALAAARGQQPRGEGSDDVGDPFRRGAAAFATMADELDPALAVLVAALLDDSP